METVMQDVRYGLRMLFRNPAFTLVAVLSLALGIGANTTIFTLVNTVLLHPVPVRDPGSLAMMFMTDEQNKNNQFNLFQISHLNYNDYRDQNEVFSGTAAWLTAPINLSGGGEPEQIAGDLVSGNFLSLLGVSPALGRDFLLEEDKVDGASPVAILGDRLWKRRYASDPAIVGKSITLNGQSFNVVGVTPPGFQGINTIGGPDLWVPMAMHGQILSGFFAENYNERRALLFNVIGRLKPGVTIQQAEGSLRTIAARLEKEYPEPNKGRSVTLLPMAQATVNPNLRRLFVMAGGLLMTVVGLVLLIACANVANLLLARATARRKEIAIRLSMGAGRWRLVRQLMTESVVLALLGGCAGLLVAFWARDLVMASRPPQFFFGQVDLSLDTRVLVFTLLVSVATGVVFGLVPALQASRSNLVVELKERTGQSGRSGARFNFRSVLVVAQVALSLVSLIGAGLFLRSLRNTERIDPGFDAKNLLTVQFDLGAQGFDRTRGEDFHRRILETARAIPGVRAAALSANLPMGGGFGRTVFPEGQEAATGAAGQFTNANEISVGYFDALGIPLRHGRDINDMDRDGAPRVVVINEAMAKQFWKGQDALGKRFKFFGDQEYRQVVGIVGDTKIFTLGEDAQPQAFIPVLQQFNPTMTLNVRTQADGETLLPTLRREVQALQPTMPLTNVQTTDELLRQVLWAPRMGAALLGIFGLIALTLAAIGIYGVMSYSVNQRTVEFGLRMALGARPSDVLGLVLRQGMLLVACGLLIGVVTAFFASSLISALLVGMSATDPITFLLISLLLAAVAALAGYVPARRATRVDPMVALRYE
ncbi:MAG TPA: ABC transporter permease [Candidatus Polarisedimenticolia bacterium]|nr:ABC transporter permease [Candidatus Polarisedimenticolia bacterium]